MRQKQLDLDLEIAARNGNLPLLRQRLRDGANAQASAFGALWVAAKYGQLDCLKELLPVSSDDGIRHAFGNAASKGQLTCLEYLLTTEYGKRRDCLQRALFDAIDGGRILCVKTIIPFLETERDTLSAAMSIAAQYGNAEIVALLLPIADKKHENSNACGDAAINGHIDCVRILFEAKDLNEIMKYLHDQNASSNAENIIHAVRLEKEHGVDGMKATLGRRGI